MCLCGGWDGEGVSVPMWGVRWGGSECAYVGGEMGGKRGRYGKVSELHLRCLSVVCGGKCPPLREPPRTKTCLGCGCRCAVCVW